MIRFGSLFSGIGGLDLGLERAGMECVWQVEIDEWCSRVLAKHWPTVPRYRDIKDFLADAECAQRDEWRRGSSASRRPQTSRNDLGSVVDLICGGFPCQPVSLAGKRKGQEDARWLWPEFARTIRLLRPRYVVAENVPGLLSRGLGDVLGDLAALGYDTEWDCIPAAAVGAPHLRYRVFIVAYAKSPNGQSFRSGTGSRVLGNTSSDRLEESRVFGVPPGSTGSTTDASRWATESAIRRVVNGVPRRVDRLRGLGNAVVPQVAEYVGRRILESAT